MGFWSQLLLSVMHTCSRCPCSRLVLVPINKIWHSRCTYINGVKSTDIKHWKMCIGEVCDVWQVLWWKPAFACKILWWKIVMQMIHFIYNMFYIIYQSTQHYTHMSIDMEVTCLVCHASCFLRRIGSKIGSKRNAYLCFTWSIIFSQ